MNDALRSQAACLQLLESWVAAGWLRELLRDRPPGTYAAALELLDAYEEALGAYAHAGLAAAALALRLRAILRAGRGGPTVRGLAG